MGKPRRKVATDTAASAAGTIVGNADDVVDSLTNGLADSTSTPPTSSESVPESSASIANDPSISSKADCDIDHATSAQHVTPVTSPATSSAPDPPSSPVEIAQIKDSAKIDFMPQFKELMKEYMEENRKQNREDVKQEIQQQLPTIIQQHIHIQHAEQKTLQKFCQPSFSYRTVPEGPLDVSCICYLLHCTTPHLICAAFH